MAHKRIEIPLGIEMITAANAPLRRAMDSYIMMHHVLLKEKELCFDKKDAAIEALALRCNTTLKTLKTKRIPMLVAHGLMYERDGRWQLYGWERVRQVFQLPLSGFYRILPNTGRRIQDILLSMSVRTKIQQIKDCYEYNMKKISGLKEEMIEAAGSAQAQDVHKMQLSEFLQEGNKYAYLWDKLHADLNICTASLRKLWGQRSKGGVKYWKRKFEQQGIWQVTQRAHVLQGHKTDDSRVTRLGIVHYVREAIRLHSGTMIYGEIKDQVGPVMTIRTSGYQDMHVNADSIAEVTEIKRPVLIMPDGIKFLNVNEPMKVKAA